MQTAICRKVYIVQCQVDWDYLCPFDGSVGYTPDLQLAGKFDDEISAHLTGQEFLDHFRVIPFYEKIED